MELILIIIPLILLFGGGFGYYRGGYYGRGGGYDVSLAARLLGHRTGLTTERYYNQARGPKP
jgi:integrase